MTLPPISTTPIFSNASFIYVGGGKRVKSVLTTNIATTITYFVGAYYEVANGVVTKYYYAGSQRIAMRSNGDLKFLLGDHLGSTSLVTDANGQNAIETRYTAWGEVRYTTPNATLPTKYTYTGQYSYTADFGLMFFNARWLDVSLGRFAQADSITPRGIQGLDRYAYTANNPVRYTDPSGHMMVDEDRGGGGGIGCSVFSGSFNGSFTCTPQMLNAATIEQRKGWFNGMLASKAYLDPRLPSQFNNINGILDAFIKEELGEPGSWISWGDAGILNSIQNGLASATGEKYISGFEPADQAWNNYFTAFFVQGPSNATFKLWGAAEGLGTSYGRLLAAEHGQSKSLREITFLYIGDKYRGLLRDRKDPATLNIYDRDKNPIAWRSAQVTVNFYAWFLDPSSTIPYTNIPPVQLFAEFTLEK